MALLFSLQANQQQPLLAAASVAFANSAALSFGHKEVMGCREDEKGKIGQMIREEMAKSREEGHRAKSPDPQESPIAAGLLAGAKSVNLQKGEFRKMMNREIMMQRANRGGKDSLV